MPTLGRSQDAFDRFEAAVEVPLTVLAIAWLPLLVVPLVTNLPSSIDDAFTAADYLIWAIFVCEYLVKVYLAPSRKRFVVTHLLELVVVVVPLLRPLRIVRLLRLLTIGRAGVVFVLALRRMRGLLAHRGLHFVLLSVMGIVVVCAALELAFERDVPGSNVQDFGDALWWAVVTVTTVGYGDRYPVSAGGRGVAAILMFVAIGLVGTLTATIASYFVEAQADRGTVELHARLDRLEAMLEELTAASRGAGDHSGPGDTAA